MLDHPNTEFIVSVHFLCILPKTFGISKLDKSIKYFWIWCTLSTLAKNELYSRNFSFKIFVNLLLNVKVGRANIDHSLHVEQWDLFSTIWLPKDWMQIIRLDGSLSHLACIPARFVFKEIIPQVQWMKTSSIFFLHVCYLWFLFFKYLPRLHLTVFSIFIVFKNTDFIWEENIAYLYLICDLFFLILIGLATNPVTWFKKTQIIMSTKDYLSANKTFNIAGSLW